MKGVAIVGKKGGDGKTTLAHLLALGASWKNVPAHFVHTDDREPIKVQGRPYMYYDARRPDVLEVLINSAINADGFFILDSGGNRPEFDTWIAGAMDLLIMPVTPDPECVSVALDHMASLVAKGASNAWFVVNKVPAGINEKQFVARYLNRLPADRTLCALPERKAVRILRDDDVEPFQTPPARVNNLARNFFAIVAHHLDGGRAAERAA